MHPFGCPVAAYRTRIPVAGGGKAALRLAAGLRLLGHDACGCRGSTTLPPLTRESSWRANQAPSFPLMDPEATQTRLFLPPHTCSCAGSNQGTDFPKHRSPLFRITAVRISVRLVRTRDYLLPLQHMSRDQRKLALIAPCPCRYQIVHRAGDTRSRSP